MSFEEIIDKVKTRPEIWQPAHPLYKNKMLRLKIWKQISKELDSDAQQLKKSWKYLKDQFRREHKKLKSLAPYEGKPIPSSWAYYERLSFLTAEIAARRDRRPARIAASSDSDTATNDASAATQKSQSPGNQQDDNDTCNFEEMPWKYDIPTVQATAGFSGSASGITKADLILQHLRTLNATISKSQPEQVNRDEDYMFFMSILPMVRTLAPVKKLQLRGNINEWLLQTLSAEDPLNHPAQFTVEVKVTNEDNKDSILKDIMIPDEDTD